MTASPPHRAATGGTTSDFEDLFDFALAAGGGEFITASLPDDDTFNQIQSGSRDEDILNLVASATASPEPPRTVAETTMRPSTSSAHSIGTATETSQLISPMLTNTPYSDNEPDDSLFPTGLMHLSTASGTGALPQGTRLAIPEQTFQPTPAISQDENSSTGTLLSRRPTPGPRIDVSFVSRGDSPRRDEHRARGRSWSRTSQRSNNSLLSAPRNPLEDSSSSESDISEEGGPSDTLRPVQPPRSRRNSDTGDGNSTGFSPQNRTDEELVASVNELAIDRSAAEKNNFVKDWLSNSKASSDVEDSTNQGSLAQTGSSTRHRQRRRAHSALASTEAHSGIGLGLGINPGLLMEEARDFSSYEDSSGSYRSYSPPISPKQLPQDHESQPDTHMGPASVNGDTLGSLPSPAGTRFEDDSKSGQFGYTAKEAMYRLEERSKPFDAMSRRATWGSKRTVHSRRMSAGDAESIRSRHTMMSILRNEIVDTSDKTPRPSLFSTLRRSSSNIKQRFKRHQSEDSSVDKPKPNHGKKDSLGDINISSRSPILGRSPSKSFLKSTKSPPPSVGSAFVAMAGLSTTIGGANSLERSTRDHVGRNRSKSEIPSGVRPPGFVNQMRTQLSRGEASVSPLLTPGLDNNLQNSELNGANTQQLSPAHRVQVDTSRCLVPQSADEEGFRRQIYDLNPQIDITLASHIVKAQMKRYQTLTDKIAAHKSAVLEGSCKSHTRCVGRGGKPQYSNGLTQSNGEMEFALPPLIPTPPVTHFPVELECPICNEVKKFNKPSDWTKHVHEDIQPFTCTFPECDPQNSLFVRKADWVRHENEKHRHLESWKCNQPDCSHVCHRRDNFVQHLVREHKVPQAKTKSRASNATTVGGTRNLDGNLKDESLKLLVESCHHYTAKVTAEEPCRFCGNISGEWSELSRHLAKHLEQIALPILEMEEIRSKLLLGPVPSATPQASNSASPIPPKAEYSPYVLSPHPDRPDLNTTTAIGLGQHAPEANLTESSYMFAPRMPSSPQYPQQYHQAPENASSAFSMVDATSLQRSGTSYPPTLRAQAGILDYQARTNPEATTPGLGPAAFAQAEIATTGPGYANSISAGNQSFLGQNSHLNQSSLHNSQQLQNLGGLGVNTHANPNAVASYPPPYNAVHHQMPRTTHLNISTVHHPLLQHSTSMYSSPVENDISMADSIMHGMPMNSVDSTNAIYTNGATGFGFSSNETDAGPLGYALGNDMSNQQQSHNTASAGWQQQQQQHALYMQQQGQGWSDPGF